MYARHFGLQQPPFSIAPDPRFLFMSERHREALAHLLYGLQSGGGFVLLTGAIGAGKTTVCRAFLEQVPPHCQVAYIFNPQLTAEELLQTVCQEFGVTPRTSTRKGCVDALNEHLLAAYAQGRHCVLVVDEAQNLASDVLEQLRLLTNLETDERKLLQIILIGQPELRALLARPELEQLGQRVIARYHLGPLDADDTARYVSHRLAVAGSTGALPFTAGALAELHRQARGVPRRINLLADRALLGAYANGLARVTRKVMRRAAAEVLDGGGLDRPAARWWPWAAGAATLAIVGAGAGLALTAPGAGRVAPAGAAPAAAVAGAVFPPPSTATPSAVPAPPSVRAEGAVPAPGTAGPSASTASAPSGIASAATAPPGVPAGILLAAVPPAQADAAEALLVRLAARWPGSTPATRCDTAPTSPLQCLRTQRLTLATVAALDRPGLVTLALGGATPWPALLLRLDGERATLHYDGADRVLTRAAFGAAWRGDFTTFWRAPEGGLPPSSDWLDGALDRALPGVRGPLAARVMAFQRAQGLVADGQAGALTLMQLNRALGVPEPRLSAPPP